MAAEVRSRARRRRALPTLRISYDADHDFMHALVPGAVVDGQADDETDELLEGLFVYRDGHAGRPKGFGVADAFAWDVLAQEQGDGRVWGGRGLRFDVPTLALTGASIGEITLAAQATIHGSTPDVVLFDHAVATSARGEWEEAEPLWRLCLETGEMKAHFGLGYTLVELGRPREAFGHLCMYTEITPRLAWAWVWRGRAAQDMGERDEARASFARGAEADPDNETEALERLEELG